MVAILTDFLATLGFYPFCFFGIFEPAGLNILIMKGFQMSRRVVIYIRISSESQVANSSPIEQETDCLHPAQKKGLQVIRVYRDVEKYWVGSITGRTFGQSFRSS